MDLLTIITEITVPVGLQRREEEEKFVRETNGGILSRNSEFSSKSIYRSNISLLALKNTAKYSRDLVTQSQFEYTIPDKAQYNQNFPNRDGPLVSEFGLMRSVGDHNKLFTYRGL